MRKQQRIAGLLLTSLGILILLSLIHFNPWEPTPNQANEVQHSMGLVGFWISYYIIKKTIGYAAFVFPLLIITWGITLVATAENYKRLFKITLYLLLFSFYISILTAIFSLPKNISPDHIVTVTSQPPYGMIGGISCIILHRYFGGIGSIIVFFTIVLITILNIIEINFANIFFPFQKAFVNLYKLTTFKFGAKKITRKSRINTGQGFPSTDLDYEKVKATQDQEEMLSRKSPMKEFPEESFHDEEETEEELLYHQEVKSERERKTYLLPPTSLLDQPPEREDEVSWDEFMMSAKTLEEKLADFGIEGKVVEINPGPIITRYEIEPAPGVKVNRFTSLADDLALVMRAKRIRVVAPIPGKAAIGIEIPNRKPQIVYMKEIIDSPQFKSSSSVLTLALGKTIAGDIFVTDLTTMPHLLVAGATGSGKSVSLHSIIVSMLYKAQPSQVQLVLIDPKRLELSPYASLKNYHLAYREDLNEVVVTTAQNAISVLKSLEQEMERRYKLLAQEGVRNIEDYNNSLKTSTWNHARNSEHKERLPYIILIIDELADLMSIAAREVEEPIARLTQMSRAVGIHLIVATQRPSVDVITGVIKANFPARMAFQVATKTDSRTILDMNGAEKLLGKGDMLLLPPGSPEPIRIHGAFISHEEVKRVIEHIKQQPPPESKTILITDEEIALTSSEARIREERDDLFEEALKLVVRHQQGSSSLLQRRLKIGYTRAARIIDQLEQAGFVGPYDGSKAREVLITDEELREIGII